MASSIKIKVDKKIKPLHPNDRKPIELVIGNHYFVSFGNNTARQCTLVEVDTERKDVTRVTISSIVKRGHHEYESQNCLFADEIGLTPEEAVLNEVTL